MFTIENLTCIQCCDPIDGDGNITVKGTLCDQCFDLYKRTPRPEPVIVWRERAQPALISTPDIERKYTVPEVAEILNLSPNQVTKIFRDEPGVEDWASKLKGKRLRKKGHKSRLRIPHCVLVRVCNRRKIGTTTDSS
jgi:hypothetical protein